MVLTPIRISVAIHKGSLFSLSSFSIQLYENAFGSATLRCKACLLGVVFCEIGHMHAQIAFFLFLTL